MKRRILLTVLVISVITTTGWVGTRALTPDSDVTAYKNSNLLRFHCIANSDRPEDQAVKLIVRDAILRETEDLFRDADSPQEAAAIGAENLDVIEDVANKVLAENGETYRAKAMVGRFEFPIKRYGDLVLPPGKYNALRVVLGEGKGQNWWCVLFPPLCFKDFDSGFAISAAKKVSAVGELKRAQASARPEIRFSLRSIERTRTGDLKGNFVMSKVKASAKGKASKKRL